MVHTHGVEGSTPPLATLDEYPSYGILAQLGEHLPYKQRVIGSSPIGPIDYGWIPEWPKGADCKSVGTAFEGSNPSPPTKPYHWLSRCGSIGRAADL